jgi:hypothetical protein
VTALVTYISRDFVRSQRWVAPVLSFLVVVATVDANSGSVLPTYATSAALLLFISTWVTITVNNTEDPVQQEVTGVTAGGRLPLHLAKLATAYLLAVLLSIAALIGPLLALSKRPTFEDVSVGLGSHLLTGLAGVALGALLSRPIIRRTAWALLIAVTLGLADTIVPGAPPVRQLLTLLNKQPPFAIGAPMAIVAAETILFALVAVGAAVRLARLRS